MWDVVRDLFVNYMGSGWITALFLVAVLFLLFAEKDKVFRIVFLYVPIVLLLLFFNPIFIEVIYGIIGEQIYYRILWLIPITMVIGYTIVKITGLLNEKKRIAFLGVACVVLIISGKPMYKNVQYSVADNLYHVPQEVVEICDAIKVEGREVLAVFPMELVQYVRQYCPEVCLPYGREILLTNVDGDNILSEMMEPETLQVQMLCEEARRQGCHFLIIPQDKVLEGNFREYSYKHVLQSGKYDVYQDVTVDLSI